MGKQIPGHGLSGLVLGGDANPGHNHNNTTNTNWKHSEPEQIEQGEQQTKQQW